MNQGGEVLKEEEEEEEIILYCKKLHESLIVF